MLYITKNAGEIKMTCEEDRDFYRKIIPTTGFIMFIAGLAVGKFFMGWFQIGVRNN